MIKEKVLNFYVSVENEENILKDICDDYLKNKKTFIVNINPEIVMANYRNENIIKIFNNQKYQIPDGIGIVFASKLQKGAIKKRITGIDLMHKICEKCSEYDSKIFLYGAKENVVTKAKEQLEKRYHEINIVGTVNGYTDEEEVITKINKSGADILFVGIGSPKQEEFIIKNQDKLKNVVVFMPVGGSFDVISGELRRAPNWMIKMNLEWLYRLIQEPKRIKRYFNLIKFMFLIILKVRRKT